MFFFVVRRHHFTHNLTEIYLLKSDQVFWFDFSLFDSKVVILDFTAHIQTHESSSSVQWKYSYVFSGGSLLFVETINKFLIYFKIIYSQIKCCIFILFLKITPLTCKYSHSPFNDMHPLKKISVEIYVIRFCFVVDFLFKRKTTNIRVTQMHCATIYVFGDTLSSLCFLTHKPHTFHLNEQFVE